MNTAPSWIVCGHSLSRDDLEVRYRTGSDIGRRAGRSLGSGIAQNSIADERSKHFMTQRR